MPTEKPNATIDSTIKKVLGKKKEITAKDTLPLKDIKEAVKILKKNIIKPIKGKYTNPPKKKNKGGRPRFKLSDEQRKLAIEYVTFSGFWKVRLSKFLRTDNKTLDRLLIRDKGFSKDLEAAEAVFIGNTIKGAKPEFILKTKYRDEFPDNSFDPGAGQGGEELEAVILRIRKILPPSGQ